MLHTFMCIQGTHRFSWFVWRGREVYSVFHSIAVIVMKWIDLFIISIVSKFDILINVITNDFESTPRRSHSSEDGRYCSSTEDIDSDISSWKDLSWVLKDSDDAIQILSEMIENGGLNTVSTGDDVEVDEWS